MSLSSLGPSGSGEALIPKVDSTWCTRSSVPSAHALKRGSSWAVGAAGPCCSALRERASARADVRARPVRRGNPRGPVAFARTPTRGACFLGTPASAGAPAVP
jgi:hypothetical protein